MTNNKIQKNYNIRLKVEQIEFAENYVYLGQNIKLKDIIQDKEIQRRIQLGWRAFDRLNYIFKSELPLCLKGKIFNICIIPTMTYEPRLEY